MFDLTKSLEDAERRFGTRGRKQRSDRGASRFDPAARDILNELLGGTERPRISALLSELESRCADVGAKPPSRATVYNHRDRAPLPSVVANDLPEAVRRVLYNLAPDASVPTHQIAFRAINEGGLRALSYAAGLPWLALHRARLLRGSGRSAAGRSVVVRDRWPGRSLPMPVSAEPRRQFRGWSNNKS